MEGPELIAEALGRVNQILHRSLDNAPPDTLNRMPTEGTNSIAWLAWHLTRVHDDHLSDLEGQPQLWIAGDWHKKFGMPPNEKETGGGHTLEQVAAFRVESVDVLLDYNDAVLERTKAFLATLDSAALDRELDEPQYTPLPTVGVRLVSVVSDNTQHAGQIGYLRGYFDGFGWRR